MLLWFHLSACVFGRDTAFEGASQWMSLIPGKLGNLLRTAFYCSVLEECDRTVTVSFGTLLSKSGSRLGSHVYIGPQCHVGLVSIGRDTLIGPLVQIPSGPRTHRYDSLEIPIRKQGCDGTRITIGENCWLGAGSVIMADVGNHSVVGAGSVVTKPIAEKTVAVGVPAKTIRQRDG